MAKKLEMVDVVEKPSKCHTLSKWRVVTGRQSCRENAKKKKKKKKCAPVFLGVR